MDPEYLGQMQRLQQFRCSLSEAKKEDVVAAATSAPEVALHGDNARFELGVVKTASGSSIENESLSDPLIYPGLYAPSGIDMMGILVRVRTRPNPVIDIGNIDSSAALILCDTALPDLPIVYCSEPFEVLTGYSSDEILGRNCRFLQHPYSHPSGGRGLMSNNTPRQDDEQLVAQENEKPLAQLRETFARGEEAQVRLLNYTKGGEKFYNLLTTIPITWDDGDKELGLGLGKRYIVGFQAQDNMKFK